MLEYICTEYRVFPSSSISHRMFDDACSSSNALSLVRRLFCHTFFLGTASGLIPAPGSFAASAFSFPLRTSLGPSQNAAASGHLQPLAKRRSVYNQRSPVCSSRQALLQLPTAASNRKKVRAFSRGAPSDVPDTDGPDHRCKHQDPCSASHELPARATLS